MKDSFAATLPTPVSFERELRWARACLAPEADRLARFVNDAFSFDTLFLSGDYSGCLALLDTIDQAFGISLWAIARRIALLQLRDGLEAQKRYVESIKQDPDRCLIASFVAHFVSTRNEPSVTPGRFFVNSRRHGQRLGLRADISAFVYYHIAPEHSYSLESAAAILAYHSVAPAVDYYEALITLCRLIVGDGRSDLHSEIARALDFAIGKVQDPRMRVLAIASEAETGLPAVNPAALQAYDSFVSGNYLDAVRTCAEACRIAPADPDVLLILARVIAVVPDIDTSAIPFPQYLSIATQLAAVLARRPNYTEQLLPLSRLLVNFAYRPWTERLSAATEVAAYDPAPPDKRVAQLKGALFQAGLHPLNMSVLSEGMRDRYLSALEAHSLPPSSSQYGRDWQHLSLSDAASPFYCPDETRLLEAHLALAAGDLPKALVAADALRRSASRYYSLLGMRTYCDTLVASNRLLDAAAFITHTCIDSPDLWSVMPLAYFVATVESSLPEYAASISIPIALSLYSKHCSDRVNHLQAYACEDFLAAHGLQRPSELISLLDAFPRSHVIYFLRELAIEQVMDSFTIFDSTSALAEERLTVLRQLSELDSDNADSYVDETKRLVTASMVRTRIREIERSKIYVDVAGVRRSARAKLEEPFARYVQLLRLGIASSGTPALEEAMDLIAKRDPVELGKLRLPPTEANELLHSMILDLRDEYVSSTEYGLDGYLSVRIRHGTLAGQLRGPLEAAHLLSNRDRHTGAYRENKFWLEKLDPHSAPHHALHRSLVTFSKGIDDSIQTLATQWIQIKTRREDPGLFNFVFTQQQVALIASFVNADPDLDSFIDSCLGVCLQMLEHSLDEVRSALRITAKAEFTGHLSRLQQDIQRLTLPHQGDLLSAISAATTDIQVAIERITEWFRLTKTTGQDPFDVRDAITISTEAVRRSHNAAFDARVSLIGESDYLFAAIYLPAFVDILSIIFENIVRHADTDRPAAAVDITFSIPRVTFRVENDVAPHVRSAAVETRLGEIRQGIIAKRYLASISREGGTGFHKLAKILAHDFGNSPNIDFGFMHPTRFFVEFYLNVMALA